ncbi:bifunctional nuclease family protein [Rapidithrix thailandica]|uniref:Bifunctional nuclease family protein n=1 Tax=Rapidithrix thailandica TaxID=413964 RepID=A0AAW9SD53_9BACT
MNKVKLEILGLSASHSQSGSFALVLGEEEGTRRLPIIIGMFEAQAIAIEMEKIVSNRPMTHDLFKSFAINFEIDLHEVIISDLKEGVFYAKIICAKKDGSNFIELDARPSDAVAIGIRFGVPIYAYEAILEEAGIELSDIDEGEESNSGKKASTRRSKSKKSSSTSEEGLKDLPLDELKEMMEKAIAKEDYERAAKIRDEINRRQ